MFLGGSKFWHTFSLVLPSMRDPIPAHLNGDLISRQYYLFEKYRYFVPSPFGVHNGFYKPNWSVGYDSDQQIQQAYGIAKRWDSDTSCKVATISNGSHCVQQRMQSL
jgi:hypothetical protein